MTAWRMSKRIEDDEFIRICESSASMAKASAELGLHFNSFKNRALDLGCCRPNQSGKGSKKSIPDKVSLTEILEGSHPHFQTFKLKKRLIKAEMIESVCAVCGISEWNGKKLALELDHIDGNSRNHKLENLRLLCPNCHSQTVTYRAKNRSRKI